MWLSSRCVYLSDPACPPGVHGQHIDVAVVASNLAHARIPLKGQQLLASGCVRRGQCRQVSLCLVKGRLRQAHERWVVLYG